MTFQRTLALVMLLSGLMLPTVTSAQTREDVAKAQQHFQNGAEWYAKGDYAKAVVEFMSGHALAPNAMFLYNVSLSYERLGRIEDSLSAAEKAKSYEGMPPEVENRNEARIRALHVAVRSQTVAQRMSQVASRDGDTDGGSGGDGDDTQPKLVERPDGVQALGWTGLGLAAVGGGFAVAGLLVNSSINADIEAYEEAARTEDRATYDELRDSIGKRQQRGKIFYAVAASAAGIGLTLFVIDLVVGTEEVPVTTFVAPSGSGGPVVGATLRF